MNEINRFLNNYSEVVQQQTQLLRSVIMETLPKIIETPDLPAKMIAYTYGPNYADVICVIFPSKKGVKLSFNRGPLLPDPEKILEGTAKTTRYITIKNDEQILSPVTKELLQQALKLYRENN